MTMVQPSTTGFPVVDKAITLSPLALVALMVGTVIVAGIVGRALRRRDFGWVSYPVAACLSIAGLFGTVRLISTANLTASVSAAMSTSVSVSASADAEVRPPLVSPRPTRASRPRPTTWPSRSGRRPTPRIAAAVSPRRPEEVAPAKIRPPMRKPDRSTRGGLVALRSRICPLSP